LDDTVVVDCLDDEDQIARDLGAAAAFYLQTTLKNRDVIGISSWSAALLAMVNAMHPAQKWLNTRVVQILGGVGDPGAEVHATQVTTRLADLIGADVTLLPAPGVVGSRESRDVLVKDRFVSDALAMFSSVTVALVGIGATEPSRGLASSGNVFSGKELRRLTDQGAVGDVCLRFFDGAGKQVVTELNDRVISIELDQLRAVPRVIGVAGGRRKTQAICGALTGGLLNVLITDLKCAERLLSEPAAPSMSAPVMRATSKARTKR
jgi:DNA-binding transcriptional regulator LsrR (DeoR family)